MLEFVFLPLTVLPPVISVLIFSIIMTFIVNIFYRIMINQNEAKASKDRISEISKQMKEEQKKGNTEKSGELLKEMMKENSRTMHMTLKPMMISLIIVIILLPAVSSFYGDKFADSKGTVSINGKDYQVQADGSKISIENQECSAPCRLDISGMTQEISIEKSKVKLAPVVALLPFSIPVAGDNLGWLGWYFIVSMPSMILIRKLMKIYI